MLQPLHALESRRKSALIAALTIAVGLLAVSAVAQTALLDPATQPRFVNDVPDALDPGFIYQPTDAGGYDYYEVGMYEIEQPLGLIDPVSGAPLLTKCYAYGTGPGFPNATYPGRTFIVQKDRQVRVRWSNNLTVDGSETGPVLPQHLVPVDETLHWAFALPGYELNSIASDGIPVVPHVHGGHTEWQSDGNPEFWFTPGFRVKGPRWVKDTYVYDNDQQAGTIWYHDHGLGITRLNVYAGLAGFFIIRDAFDTGLPDNPVGLPAHPYEQLLVIQDHMFDANGQHFYPAFPGDPGYADFIDPAANPPSPTALAEFFGDFILVNGVPWPKMEVEPRVYRLRLLNGSDSRVYKLWLGAPDGVTNTMLHVIGNDDGLLYQPAAVEKLVIAPGERYDVLVDFGAFAGQQLVMRNNARGPYPAGATVDPNTTGQIMAFNVGTVVTDPTNNAIPMTLRPAPITPNDITMGDPVATTRQLALYEGMDDRGRLQPLLGLAAPATDVTGGVQDGALVWDECKAPITENPGLNDVEIWEVYNTTGDAHPFHVHLVSFQILDRQKFKADLLPKDIVQHDGSIGLGFSMANIRKQGQMKPPAAHEAGWKDTAVMLPGEVTRIMARFDRPGRYVYHCHILSHEDHEMMRPYHVGPWDPATDMPYPCHDHGAKSMPTADFALEMNAAPNPFNPLTKISYALPRSAHVHLLVYDIRGRLVQVLAEGEQPAGTYTFEWNGRNQAGSQVASGTYFARLETSLGSQVKKLVMLK
jgi:spore coat protein A